MQGGAIVSTECLLREQHSYTSRCGHVHVEAETACANGAGCPSRHNLRLAGFGQLNPLPAWQL